MVLRVLLSVLLLVLIALKPLAAQAQDPELVDVFKDSLYGGLIGVVVGAAALAFTSEPEDHLEFIGIGAAVGALAGTAYGIFSASRTFATVEGSRLTFNLPTPQAASSRPAGPLGPAETEWRVSLVRVRF